MIARDSLHDPEVCRWLGNVEPAWTLLDMESLNALRRGPSNDTGALRLAHNLNVPFGFHQHSQAFTDDYVIISQENGNLFHVMGV